MSNKLLLVKDVEHLGRSGDIVHVKSPGYARNFLIPKGLAILATKGTVRMQERLQEERRQKALEEKKEAEAIAQVLQGLQLEKIVKVDPEGHMYGSVTVAEIVELIKNQHPAIELDKKVVVLKHPIKSLGVHGIELKFKEDVKAAISIKVSAEGAEEAAPAAQEQ